jgi:hypothetical protein
MNTDERRECMNVTNDDIKSVTVAEVDAKRAELKAKGYIT